MLFLSFLSPMGDGLFRVAGCSRACGNSLFPLSASTKVQSSGQNGHYNDRLQKLFQSISPPFVASCTARVGSHGQQRICQVLWMYRRLNLTLTGNSKSQVPITNQARHVDAELTLELHASITTGVPSSIISNNSITSSLRILTQP